MKKAASLLYTTVLYVIFSCSCQNQSDFPDLKGPYLGQKPPGNSPEIFAPGIVSTRYRSHSAPSFSPDGTEVFWSAWLRPYPNEVILHSKQVNGKWTKPQLAPFITKFNHGGPFFSPGGKKLFFHSLRPVPGSTDIKEDLDIWCVKRTDNGYGEPQHLSVNTGCIEANPVVVSNGNLYFCANPGVHGINYNIYISRYENGQYLKPVKLDENINHPDFNEMFFTVSPDEGFIIFSRDSRKFSPRGEYLSGDRQILISYKTADGGWTKAKKLWNNINSEGFPRLPGLTHDGKYFFFTKYENRYEEAGEKLFTYDEILKLNDSPGYDNESVYWVDAGFIEELNQDK